MAKKFNEWLNEKPQINEGEVKTDDFRFSVRDNASDETLDINNIDIEDIQIPTGGDVTPMERVLSNVNISDKEEAKKIREMVNGYYKEMLDAVADDCEKILDTAVSLMESKLQTHFNNYIEKTDKELEKFKGEE